VVTVEYELRIIVEKVAVSSQEVVKRDTLKIYDVKRPESMATNLTRDTLQRRGSSHC